MSIGMKMADGVDCIFNIQRQSWTARYGDVIGHEHAVFRVTGGRSPCSSLLQSRQERESVEQLRKEA